MDKKYPIPEPLNTDERYMHAMIVRLDALCHMLSTVIEHIGKKDGVTVEANKVETKSAPKKAPTRKLAKKED